MSSAAPGGAKEQGRSEFGVALFLGALGLLVIVQALCDLVLVHTTPAGTTVRLHLRLAGA